MKLDAEKILERANKKYRALKSEKGFDLKYPEARPEIYSDQVLAMLEAIVEAVNKADQAEQEFLFEGRGIDLKNAGEGG